MDAAYIVTAHIPGAHEMAVRSLLTRHGAAADYPLLSGSSDRVLKMWRLAEGTGGTVAGAAYEEARAAYEHENGVVALVEVAGSENLAGLPAGGAIATGSMDKRIRLYGHDGVLLRTLEGHEKQVISLTVADGAGLDGGVALVSGSWDGTARVWDAASGACLGTLGGHGNGVCVLALTGDTIATGAAGRQDGNVIVESYVRIWRRAAGGSPGQYTAVATAKDHSGPVRHLAGVSDVCAASTAADAEAGSMLPCFVSCSNDGSIVLRDGGGGAALARGAHGGFVFGVGAIGGGTGRLVSVGDEGEAKVWQVGRGGGGDWELDCVQIIPHTGSLWCTVPLTPAPSSLALAGTASAPAFVDGFVTGADDGSITVFVAADAAAAASSASDVAASGMAAALNAFNDAVEEAQSARAAAQAGGGVDASSLAAVEEQQSHPGTKDGEVRMFRKGGDSGAAWAYSWSAASGTWIEIGEVTGSGGGSGGGGGGSGGTIDGVAYDFVIPVEVPRPGGFVDKLQLGYNTGENPWTVAQKFVDEHNCDQQDLPQIADFITQQACSGAAHRTIGMEAAAPPSSTPGAFTGQPTAAVAAPALTSPFASLAHRNFATMPKLEAVLKKVTQLAQDNAQNGPLTLEELEASLPRLAAVLGDSSRYHAAKVGRADVRPLFKMLGWPASAAFPALDLLRLVALVEDGAGKLAAANEDFVPLALRFCSDAAVDAGAPARLIALRMACNLAVHRCGRRLLQSRAGVALDAIDAAVAAADAADDGAGAADGDKPRAARERVRVAAAALLLNLCIMQNQDLGEDVAAPVDVAPRCLCTCAALLRRQNTVASPSADVCFSAVAAAGSLLSSGGRVPQADAALQQAAASAGVTSELVSTVAAKLGDGTPVQGCARALASLVN